MLRKLFNVFGPATATSQLKAMATQLHDINSSYGTLRARIARLSDEERHAHNQFTIQLAELQDHAHRVWPEAFVAKVRDAKSVNNDRVTSTPSATQASAANNSFLTGAVAGYALSSVLNSKSTPETQSATQTIDENDKNEKHVGDADVAAAAQQTTLSVNSLNDQSVGDSRSGHESDDAVDIGSDNDGGGDCGGGDCSAV